MDLVFKQMPKLVSDSVFRKKKKKSLGSQTLKISIIQLGLHRKTMLGFLYRALLKLSSFGLKFEIRENSRPGGLSELLSIPQNL